MSSTSASPSPTKAAADWRKLATWLESGGNAGCGEDSTLVGTALSLAKPGDVTPGRDGLFGPRACAGVNFGGCAASGMSRRLEVDRPTALTVDCGGSNGELPAMTMVTSARITFAATAWLDGILSPRKKSWVRPLKLIARN